MKFKGTFATSQSGSLAGITASHNRGGQYLRNRTIPTDPASSFQTARRNVFRTLVTRWTNTLTQAQRDSWITYADNTPFVNALGDPLILTGQNAYIGSNTLRVQAGIAQVATAPAIFERCAIGELTPIADAAADEFEIEFDNSQAWATAVGGALLVFASKPQNASIRFFKGPFRYGGKIAGAVVPPTSPQTVPSPYVFAAGQRIFLRFVAITADGRWSNEYITSVLAS